MNRKYDLILFDLDGTVFDTADTILNSLKAVIEKLGLRKLTDEEISTFIGPPALQSFKRYYPECSEERINEIIDEYRKYYMEKELLNAKLFPGMLEVIKSLKGNGYKIALATYKIMKCVTPLFDYNDLTKYFDTLRGSVNESGLTKADIMKLAMEDCGVKDLDKVCMIGDTKYDLRGAIECKIYFIGANYGVGIKDVTDEEKNYSKYLANVDRPIDILAYV